MKKVERGTLYLSDPTGRRVKVRPADGKHFTYEELRTAVGGPIESILPATRGHQVWANEEGLCLGLCPNIRTAEIADMRIYALNGYPSNWKAVGRLLETYKVDATLPIDDTERVTIDQAVRS